MLDLDSPRWSELSHAYGSASDIPEELRRLEGTESDDDFETDVLGLLASLEHQGDSCNAAFAAAPHLARIGEAGSLRRRAVCIEAITLFELARQRWSEKGIPDAEVPADLAEAYFSTVRRLPEIIIGCFQSESDFEAYMRLISAYLAAEGKTDSEQRMLWAWHPDAKARMCNAHRELFPDDYERENTGPTED